MNSFPFLLIHPDFTIVMLSMIGFHLDAPLHHTACLLSGYSSQNSEHHGSDGILAGTGICRLGSSLQVCFLIICLWLNMPYSSQVVGGWRGMYQYNTEIKKRLCPLCS